MSPPDACRLGYKDLSVHPSWQMVWRRWTSSSRFHHGKTNLRHLSCRTSCRVVLNVSLTHWKAGQMDFTTPVVLFCVLSVVPGPSCHRSLTRHQGAEEDRPRSSCRVDGDGGSWCWVLVLAFCATQCSGVSWELQSRRILTW